MLHQSARCRHLHHTFLTVAKFSIFFMDASIRPFLRKYCCSGVPVQPELHSRMPRTFDKVDIAFIEVLRKVDGAQYSIPPRYEVSPLHSVIILFADMFSLSSNVVKLRALWALRLLQPTLALACSLPSRVESYFRRSVEKPSNTNKTQTKINKLQLNEQP